MTVKVSDLLVDAGKNYGIVVSVEGDIARVAGKTEVFELDAGLVGKVGQRVYFDVEGNVEKQEAKTADAKPSPSRGSGSAYSRDKAMAAIIG